MTLPAIALLQCVLDDYVFLDWSPSDQVFLDDSLQHFRRAGMIPCALGIDDRSGTLLTDLKTIGFCAIDAALTCQVQFF